MCANRSHLCPEDQEEVALLCASLKSASPYDPVRGERVKRLARIMGMTTTYGRRTLVNPSNGSRLGSGNRTATVACGMMHVMVLRQRASDKMQVGGLCALRPLNGGSAPKPLPFCERS
jgi:hypothetical protein